MTQDRTPILPVPPGGEHVDPHDVIERSSGETPGTATPPRVGWGFIVSFTLALFGIWVLIMTPATVSLALRVSQIDPDNATSSYSLVAGVGALFALIANPLFGRLSDMTTSRFGMRRPWIVLGTAGGAASAFLMATAPDVPTMFVGWALMQLLVNAAVAALVAVVADQVPESQTGLMSGIIGMTPTAGILVGSFVVQLAPDNPFVFFMLPALVAVVTVTVFLIVLKDRVLTSKNKSKFNFREFAASFVLNPRQSPALSWYLLCMFLVACGLGVIQTYLFFLTAQKTGVTEAELPTVMFYLVLLMNVISLTVAFTSGTISDRTGGKRIIFAVGGVAIAAGAVITVLTQNLSELFLGVGVAGLGYGLVAGIYIAVARPVMTDQSSSARDFGLINLAFTLPSSLVPFVAPLLLSIGGGDNYFALFMFGAILTLAGVPLLAKVKAR